MHGTFLTTSSFKRKNECSVHHVPLIREPIVGTLLYKVGDPEPLAFPANGDRCPKCYPTVQAMMKMCVQSFVQQIVSVDRKAAFKLDKMVVLWKDGRREEYPLT